MFLPQPVWLGREVEDMIKDIAKRLKDSRRAWFDLVRVSKNEGLSYDQVCQELSEENISPPSRGYWSTLQRVWSWAISLGFDEEEAADLLGSAGISKAVSISRLSLSKEEARSLLRWAASVSMEEVKEEVRRQLGGGEFLQNLKSIKVPESVYDMFQKARARISNVPGLPKLSEVQMIEFVSDLFLSLNQGMIRSLWLAMYGSGEERFLPEDLYDGSRP